MYRPSFIHETAVIVDWEPKIGEGTEIEAGAHIGSNVKIGNSVTVGEAAKLYGYSFVADHVQIGPGCKIGKGALILDGARIAPNNVQSGSSNAREIGEKVSIGWGVFLHDEVELGDNAVIPNQRTIVSIGNFGLKNRVVTIYGSDYGPMVSVGCQIGIDFQTLRERVEDSTNTKPDSSRTYAPYLSIFESIGNVVQRAYDDAAPLVSEIKSMRRQFIPNF